MRKELYINSNGYVNRWVVSYADFITLLLAMFAVMYAFSIQHQEPKNIMPISQNTEGMIHIIEPDGKIYSENKYKIKGVKVENTERGTVITLPDKMLFSQGSAIIEENSLNILDSIAEIIKDSDKPVSIEGHTDNTPVRGGKYASNWELSTARAVNVLKYFVSEKNIEPKRLSASGYGEYYPVAGNNSETEKAQNRRVEIVIPDSKKR